VTAVLVRRDGSAGGLSLQVAFGCREDCPDDRIPVETGLAGGGNEVVHSVDSGDASRCEPRFSESVTGCGVCAGHVEHDRERDVQRELHRVRVWGGGKAKRGPHSSIVRSAANDGRLVRIFHAVPGNGGPVVECAISC
jgi:hypothetical protein